MAPLHLVVVVVTVGVHAFPVVLAAMIHKMSSSIQSAAYKGVNSPD